MKDDRIDKVSELLFSDIDTLLGGEGAGAKSVEQTRLLQSWQVGKIISRVEKTQKLSTSETARVMERVSKMLGQKYGRRFGRRNIFYMRKFAGYYPKPKGNEALCWSHYRSLLSVDDEARRTSLENRAVAEKMSVRALNSVVTETVGFESASEERLARVLEIDERRLHMYEVVQSETGELQLDAGFGVCLRVPSKSLHLMQPGDIAACMARQGRYLNFKGGEGFRFAYLAFVRKVMDGGTVLLEVALGLEAHAFIRFRLRGVKVMKAGTEMGDAAMRFVAERLTPGKQVLIHSYCAETWGEYSADVFYSPSGQCSAPDEGEYLNRELLESGLGGLVG
ncbi:MAG: hypothetical protein JXR76_08670 [Deltaproteobacteria bacterium]|nr:hypothetical protein [Deltaproteobacteria bacterium]